MRKLFYSLFAAIGALTMASCAVDNTTDGTFNNVGKTVTVSAAIEQTRTTFDTDLHKLSWNAGDTFGLFEVDEAGEFVKHHANLPVEGTTLTLDAKTTQLYAYYPSKEDVSSFDKVTFWSAGVYNGFEGFELEDCTPLAAKASVESGRISLLFKPTVAIVELNIYGGEDGAILHSYEFYSDENCSSYAATIDWDNLTLNVDMQEISSSTEEDNEPIVDGDKANGAKVYFTVPKGVYHNAVITLYHEGGEGTSIFEFDELNLTYFGRTINLNLASGEAEEDYYLYFHKAVIDNIDDTWGIEWVQPYQSEPETIDEIVLLYDVYEKEYTYVIGVESNFEWSVVEEDSTIAGFVSVSKLSNGNWLRINVPYDSAARRLGTTETLYLANNDPNDETSYALDIIFPEAEATIELLGSTASSATFKKMNDSDTAYYKENAEEFFVTDKTIFYELEISDSSKEYYFTTSEPFIVDMSDNADYHNNPHFPTVYPNFNNASFTADDYNGLDWTLSFDDMESFENDADNTISLYHITDTGIESVFLIHVTLKEAAEEVEYHLSGLIYGFYISDRFTWKELNAEDDEEELVAEDLGDAYTNGTKIYKLTFESELDSYMYDYAKLFSGYLPLEFVFAAPYNNTPWINTDKITEQSFDGSNSSEHYYSLPFDFTQATKECRKGTISFYESGSSSYPAVALIVDFKYTDPDPAGNLTFTYSVKADGTSAAITITPSDEQTQYALVSATDNGWYGSYPYDRFFSQYESEVYKTDIHKGVHEFTISAGSASVGFFGVANCDSNGVISGEWTKYFFNFSDGSEYVPSEDDGETKWEFTVSELDVDVFSVEVKSTPSCQFDAGWAKAADLEDGWDAYATKNFYPKPGDSKGFMLNYGTGTVSNLVATPNTEYAIWVLPVVDGNVYGEPIFHYFTFNGGSGSSGNGGGEEQEDDTLKFGFNFSSTAADKLTCTVSIENGSTFTNYYGIIVKKSEVDDYDSVKEYMLAKGEVKPGEQSNPWTEDLWSNSHTFSYSNAQPEDFYVCIVVPVNDDGVYDDPIVSDPYEHVYNN